MRQQLSNTWHWLGLYLHWVRRRRRQTGHFHGSLLFLYESFPPSFNVPVVTITSISTWSWHKTYERKQVFHLKALVAKITLGSLFNPELERVQECVQTCSAVAPPRVCGRWALGAPPDVSLPLAPASPHSSEPKPPNQVPTDTDNTHYMDRSPATEDSSSLTHAHAVLNLCEDTLRNVSLFILLHTMKILSTHRRKIVTQVWSDTRMRKCRAQR